MPKTAATLTPREVAELSGAPKRVIEKAIAERILTVQFRASAWGGAGHQRRMLPPHAVAFAALISKLELRLSTAHKKRLATRLSRMGSGEARTARVELAHAVEINVGLLIGDVMDRTAHYVKARDKFIISDEAIMGGTPVICGTRVTVYSVLGQIKNGDTVEDIMADNPDLSREAIEAAITYARSHPLMGRPGGRPWVDAA
jgi:uncharacterized protein (DUF433 family)